MKIKVNELEITPKSSNIKQCTISSVVELIGIIGGIAGLLSLGSGDYNLFILCIIGGTMTFGFGYMIHLLYLLVYQKYTINEAELEFVNDKPLWVNGKVEIDNKN